MRRGRFRQERRSQEDHAHNELLEFVESLIAAHLVTREALVHAPLPTVLCGLDPSFIPAIMTDLGAQSQHGIDMRALPSHPSAFESRLDHRFMRTLHTAAAKRPAQLLVKRILHLLLTLTQVVHLGLQIRHVWMLLKQKTNVLENRCGTLVLELAALRLKPVCRQFGPSLPD